MPGPFYFAWIDVDSDGVIPAFGPEHLVEDERVYRFRKLHSEGQKPLLEVDIRNPGVGILSRAERWAMFSVGAPLIVDTDPVLLFVGQAVGLGGNIVGEVVTLQLVADPVDFVAQKHALGRSLNVLPNCDKIFLDEKKRDDADAVIEGYPVALHVDARTLEVSASDYLVGEDGLVDFGTNVFYDSVNAEIGEAPLAGVKVDMSVLWKQSATGLVDIGERTFGCWNGDGFLSEWPKKGQNLGGGWVVTESSAIDLLGTAASENTKWETKYKNVTKYRDLFDDEILSWDVSYNGPRGSRPGDGTEIETNTTFRRHDPIKGIGESTHVTQSRLIVGSWAIKTSLQLGYESSQGRNEHLVFTLYADSQPILGSGSGRIETLELNGANVGIPLVTYDGLTGALLEESDPDIPISDTSRRSYFPTERGLKSVEYGINRARSMLIRASRAVEVTFEVPFVDGVELSCRKSARIADPRLPGGEASGKIIECELAGDGSAGTFTCKVKIACAIGYGNAIAAPLAGAADYIVDDYIDASYYAHVGTTVAIGAGDVSYSLPVSAGGGLVFPLRKEDVVISETVHTGLGGDPSDLETSSWLPPEIGLSTTFAEFAGFFNTTIYRTEAARKTAETKIRAAGIYYELVLRPLTDVFNIEYPIELSRLVLPQQLNLEAP